MKLTLGDARGITIGLPAVMNQKLPTKIGYWFARTLRELNNHMQDMEKVREKLLDEMAETYKKDKHDKAGKLIEKKGEKITVGQRYVFKDQKKWDEEYKKLADQEIEIKFNGITLEELEKITADQECPECKKKIPAQVAFKGMDIYNLGVLILPPDEEEKKEEKK